MARIIAYREIPLDDLVLGIAQVRTRSVGQGISELADNINKNGLLHPIVVCPTDKNGKFEILLGQRRYLAHRELQRQTIMCGVFDQTVDPIAAKVISLSENAVRSSLDRADMIDVCTALFKHYGNINDTAEKTGLSANMVRDYVKFDRLIEPLKELVNKGEIELKVAIKAQDAASVTGKPNAEEAIVFAKEMNKMSNPNRDRVVEEKRRDPHTSAQEIIERSKSGRITEIIIQLSDTVHTGLQTFAREEGTNQGDAAASLIKEALGLKGFIREEEDA